jgi:glutathione peroxidase
MSIYDLSFTDNKGNVVPLSNYKDKVLLLVNVASRCGFTNQYEGLENLYKQYNNLGFEIIAFPCNQFGSQEPGSNDEIENFCKVNYGVTFTIASKIDVNGEEADPIYKYLVENIKNNNIGWNFEKFLIAKDGSITNYQPDFTPEKLNPIIENLTS